jgi:hypothetical protein
MDKTTKRHLAVFIKGLKVYEQTDSLEWLLEDLQQNVLPGTIAEPEKQDAAKQIIAAIKAELLIRKGSQ